MRSIFDASDSSGSPTPFRKINWSRLAIGAVTVVVLIICLMGLSNLVVHLDAKDVMIIQYPNGTLRVCSQPGYYTQWFGTVMGPSAQWTPKPSPERATMIEKIGPVRLKAAFISGHLRSCTRTKECRALSSMWFREGVQRCEEDLCSLASTILASHRKL